MLKDWQTTKKKTSKNVFSPLKKDPHLINPLLFQIVSKTSLTNLLMCLPPCPHKKAILLAQRSTTLDLMMINSCSYSTNDLVLFKLQVSIKILVWCLAFSKDSKSRFNANTCWFKSSSIKITFSTQEWVKLNMNLALIKTRRRRSRRRLEV